MTRQPISITTKEQAQQLVDQFDNFLFDCDGVVWLDEELIPGMKEAIDYLTGQGKKVAFITNNSSKSREEYVAKFQRMGFEGIGKDIIYPTCYAAASHLSETLRVPKGSKIWVLGDYGIEEELREQGYVPVGGSDSRLDTEFDPNHELLNVDPDVKAVVVGSTKHFNYMRIASTLQYLLHDDKALPFIGTNIDRSYPGPRGLILPAGGSVVNFMEYTAHREFINVGKPSTLFLHTVLGHQRFEPARTLMVGDTLYTDIKFGNDGGLGGAQGGSLLVLTGGTRPQDFASFMANQEKDVSLVPAYVMPGFADLTRLLQ